MARPVITHVNQQAVEPAGPEFSGDKIQLTPSLMPANHVYEILRREMMEGTRRGQEKVLQAFKQPSALESASEFGPVYTE